jgi:lipopolysaccharide export system permease protein
MYILTRYAVWEVLKIFLAALVGLTLLVTFGMGFKVASDNGLPNIITLQLVPYMLPEMLGITLPVAMLYAVSSAFGRMTGTNEVVALKSLGISPMAVVWPVLVLTGFLSLGTVWMYEIAATWSRPSTARVICESVERIVYSVLQKNQSCDRGKFVIVVMRVEGHILVQPMITIREDGGSRITITATEGELKTDWEHRQLQFVCHNGEVDVEGQGRLLFQDERTYVVPLGAPPPDPFHRDWVAMSVIPERIAQLQDKLRVIQQNIDARKEMGDQESSQESNQIAGIENQIYRLRTEPYRRWSNGFTCVCFALIGIPVAMLWRHADGLTNFFVCFLPILAIYYPLLMLGENLTTNGILHPIFFWMGNVVLIVPGVLLLRWNIRH